MFLTELNTELFNNRSKNRSFSGTPRTLFFSNSAVYVHCLGYIHFFGNNNTLQICGMQSYISWWYFYIHYTCYKFALICFPWSILARHFIFDKTRSNILPKYVVWIKFNILYHVVFGLRSTFCPFPVSNYSWYYPTLIYFSSQRIDFPDLGL